MTTNTNNTATTNKARAFRALASRFDAMAGASSDPAEARKLAKRARIARRDAMAVEAGTYTPPAAPVTERTGAALRAHLTRTETAAKAAKTTAERQVLEVRAADFRRRIEVAMGLSKTGALPAPDKADDDSATEKGAAKAPAKAPQAGKASTTTKH